MSSANFLKYEKKALDEGFSFVIGVDEAGRGPLAGPVVAAAVHLHEHTFHCPINDSKKMTPLSRELAFEEIYEKATVGVGVISESVIDAGNILKATHHAMTVAVMRVTYQLMKGRSVSAQMSFPGKVCLLIDGNSFKSDLTYRHETIKGGDGKSLSIACASVIAKVTRDRILNTYDKIFPQYGFGRHKGYGTADHKRAIRKHGLSLIHRKSFNMV